MMTAVPNGVRRFSHPTTTKMNNQSDNAAAPPRSTVRIPTASGDEPERERIESASAK